MSRTELTTEYFDSELQTFRMDKITVDGIDSPERGIFNGPMFTFKMDYQDSELLLEKDGYLDDSTEEELWWDSPMIIEPYEYGEIDEELFLRGGDVVAKGNPTYKQTLVLFGLQ